MKYSYLISVKLTKCHEKNFYRAIKSKFLDSYRSNWRNLRVMTSAMDNSFYLLTSCFEQKKTESLPIKLPHFGYCYRSDFFGVYRGEKINRLIIFSKIPLLINTPQILKLKKVKVEKNVLFATLLKNKRLDIIYR